MPYKDPEKRRLNAKKNREKNREKIDKYQKEYRETHREQIREQQKDKYHNGGNKERQQKFKQTPKGKKVNKISDWKKMGVKCDNFDMLYENYLSETHCDFCRIKFGTDGHNSTKCLDHDHGTGLFRNFLCNKCNLKRG